MIDGQLELHLYTLVATPFVAELLVTKETDPAVGQYGSIISGGVFWLAGHWAAGYLQAGWGTSYGTEQSAVPDDFDLCAVHGAIWCSRTSGGIS